MRKTVFVSKATPSTSMTYDYQCPYIFYDRRSKKWREDTAYFDDEQQFLAKMRTLGFKIK
jgi:hypothetical protein